MIVDETVRSYGRSGIAGRRGESWLEVSAVRDSVSP